MIRSLSAETDLLNRYGVSPDEFRDSLPAAIESVRGSASADNADRRGFLGGLLDHLQQIGAVQHVEKPEYGEDTVYRISISDLDRDVAVIQKGCPDGAHSSLAWSTPEWADETYLWWLCDSMKYHPGQHVWKGVTRLKKRFFDDRPDALAGVIFQNQLCGGRQRLCPKAERSVDIGGVKVPPPCVYVMPERSLSASEWNWDGSQSRVFTDTLLRAFGIPDEQLLSYTGHIGFQRRGSGVKVNITSRFGPGRATSHRS